MFRPPLPGFRAMAPEAHTKRAVSKTHGRVAKGRSGDGAGPQGPATGGWPLLVQLALVDRAEVGIGGMDHDRAKHRHPGNPAPNRV